MKTTTNTAVGNSLNLTNKMNALNKALLGAAIASLTLLASCEKGSSQNGPCAEEYNTSYQDYKTISFTINGSDSLFQNYGLQSYPPYSPEPSDYLVKFQGYNLTMNLERIQLLGDSCAFHRQHWLILKLALNQTSFETKEYIVGSPSSQTNFQNYATYTGDALNPGEVLRFSSGDSCGTVTVTKFIPQQLLQGYFDLDVSGIDATGKFDIDLTRVY